VVAWAAEAASNPAVILFVADGMAISTVTAARILDGQNKGLAGEENLLAFEHARRPETELDPTDPDYRQRATHPMIAETHAGEDVPAYATGPGSAEVGGVMDQHELHAVMRAALFPEPR